MSLMGRSEPFTQNIEHPLPTHPHTRAIISSEFPSGSSTYTERVPSRCVVKAPNESDMWRVLVWNH
jgi:hypothetical protein